MIRDKYMKNYKYIIAELKKEFDGDNLSDILLKAIQEGERLEKQRQEDQRKTSERIRNKERALRIVPTEIIQTVQKSPLDEEVIKQLYKESLITANLASSLENKTFPKWVQDYFKNLSTSAYTLAFMNFYKKNEELDTEPKDEDRNEHIARLIAFMLREHLENGPKEKNFEYKNPKYYNRNNNVAGENGDTGKSYNNDNFYRDNDSVKNKRDQIRNDRLRNERPRNFGSKTEGEKEDLLNFVDGFLAPLFNVDPKDIKDARKDLRQTRNDMQSDLKSIFDEIFKDFNGYDKK